MTGNFWGDIRYQLSMGGMTLKLVAVNVGVFLVVSIISIFAFLFEGTASVAYFFKALLIAPNDPLELLKHPWTIFTYMFAHFQFFHILFNMILLYFTGKMFEQFYGPKRVLSTYILGGIAGLFLQVFAYNVFPVFSNNPAIMGGGVLGASGAVMAIFIGLAFYAPNLTVRLFGVFPVKLKWIALAAFLMDFIGLQRMDGVAHFAHVGGAIFGALTVINSKKGGKFMFNAERLFDYIANGLKGLVSSKPKMKVYKNTENQQRKSTYQTTQDAQRSDSDEARVDSILDKISASGYDSLTKEEKSFLFQQSRKNQK